MLEPPGHLLASCVPLREQEMMRKVFFHAVQCAAPSKVDLKLFTGLNS